MTHYSYTTNGKQITQDWQAVIQFYYKPEHPYLFSGSACREVFHIFFCIYTLPACVGHAGAIGLLGALLLFHGQ